ncbi:MAG: hypothetical protein HY548_10305 [Elusimicrobia bacterium]|nr:hypothetical protein [Elusimicrobiota bacterium]
MGSDRDDLVLPRVKLLQPLSPEVQDARGKYRAGMLINSITGLPLESEEFVPIILAKEFVKFRPRETGGGIEWRTNDPMDPRVQEGILFGAGGERLEVVAFLNFISVFGEDFGFPMVLPFCKSSYKNGKKLYSLARLSREDLFARRYRLLPKKTQNDLGTFWVLDIELVGQVSPEEYRRAELLFTSLAPERNKIVSHLEESGEGESL